MPKVNLILSLLCRDYFADKNVMTLPIIIGGDNAQCQVPEVQQLVSSFTLATSLIAGIISAITAPLLGSYSDRHGRVRVIAFTALGSIFTDLMLITVAHNYETVSVYWLIPAAAIEGVSGTFIASMALTYAYATDCTDPRRREITFGWVQAGLFTGIALGPIIAAYITKLTGDLLSIIYILVGAHLFFITWNLLVVPESLTEARQKVARARHEAERKKASAIAVAARGVSRPYLDPLWAFGRSVFSGEFFASLRVLWPTGPGSSPALRRNLVLIAGMDTCMFAVGMGVFTVIIIYSEMMFKWGTFETQILMTVLNIIRVLLLLTGLPLIAYWRQRSRKHIAPDIGHAHTGADSFDIAVIRVSVFFDLLGYIGFGLARSGAMFLGAGAVAALGSMASPTLSSALTKHVPADRTGRLLGATALLHALARVGGPALFNAVYYVTVKHFPQAVFVVLVVIFAGVVVASWFIRPNGMLCPVRLGPPLTFSTVYYNENEGSEYEEDASNERD